MSTTKNKISLNSITEAGHSEENAAMIRALCAHLDCEPSDLTEGKHDHYGLAVFAMGSQEYAIGEDAACDKAVRANIEESIWAFNADFILSECGLPSELEDGVKAWQEKECEGCNDELLRMVNRLAGDSFFDHAISADGRGHFMSSYDGEENEQTGEDTDGNSVRFYIYRTN